MARRRGGRVVRQRPAKPRTPVRLRSAPLSCKSAESVRTLFAGLAMGFDDEQVGRDIARVQVAVQVERRPNRLVAKNAAERFQSASAT